jgi:HAD superfamily hydrolase (TIGR01509 family)
MNQKNNLNADFRNIRFSFPPKIVLWDFDGCFCDTEFHHYKAYSFAFMDLTGHTLEQNHYFKRFTFEGGGAQKEIAEFNLPTTEQRILELKKASYDAILQSYTPQVFEGVYKMIEIQKQWGAKVGIASNSPREEIELILSKQAEEIELDFIQGKEAGLRKKPYPDIFLKVLKDFKIDPQHALVLEDSERGLESASAANIPAIRVLSPLNQNITVTAPHLFAATHWDLLGWHQEQK